MTEPRITPAVRAKHPDASLRDRVTVRLATDGDADMLVPMINKAYMREAWLLPPPRITLAQLHHVLDDPDQHLMLAEVDGAIAGSIRLSLHDGVRYFGLLSVALPWQGRGLAALLVAEAERAAGELGDEVLRLDCAKELGLPPFYESLGYVVESETPDSYYYGAEGQPKGPFTRVVLKKELT